jgi:hypothetical protein
MTIQCTCKMKQHNFKESIFTLFALARGRKTKERWDRLIISWRSNFNLRSFSIHGLTKSFFFLIHVTLDVCYQIQLNHSTGSSTDFLIHSSCVFFFFCLFEPRLNNCHRSLLLYSVYIYIRILSSEKTCVDENNISGRCDLFIKYQSFNWN